MRIGIIGTRGIPNHYGGFEQFAEYLSQDLTSKNVEMYVYNSHNHPNQKKIWNGVNILHKYDPEYKIGTIGQFIYDLLCIIDSRKRNFDIILQLGYTSSSIWNWLLPKNALLITNMDGLEWKRNKFSWFTKLFLIFAEYIAVKSSDFLIADSKGIQLHLHNKYKVKSKYIPYGANVFSNPSQNVLYKFSLKELEYDLIIARLEPENNIELVLDGVNESSNYQRKMIVIGNTKTEYGEKLINKYQYCKSIVFLGAVYDIFLLNNLRTFSNLYFHGHSVGGTNPSLLEAMASNTLICAHNNIFNKSILGKDAFYFDTTSDVKKLLEINKNDHFTYVSNNIAKIEKIYNWENISNEYYDLFIDCLKVSRCQMQ